MKKLNFITALLYTIFLGWVLLDSTDDGTTMLGVIILTPPVIVNWITYSKLKQNND